MAKVIPFPTKDPAASEAPDREARLLMAISDEIDAVILRHLEAGEIDPRDLAGLLAHRLGNLMKHLEEKSKLWEVCEKVAKQQAVIE